MTFDLIIKDGTVIDPSTGLHGLADVAVTRGRIAAVDRSIGAEAAREVVDASGCYVTPGLVDLHTHIFPKMTFWGVDADAVASRTGVTTFVDAGDAGAFTIDGFREFIVRRAAVRIYAFLNISCLGLVAHDYELTNLAFCSPDLFEIALDGNLDLVVGAKVRMGATTVGDNGYEPLRLARQALTRSGLPIMLHIATPPPQPEDFADLLVEGDLLTHSYTGQAMRLIDDSGKLKDFARAWIDRGVLIDVGHGTGSFTYASAEAMLAAGVKPYSISSDVHQNSIRGPMYDLPTCLDKFMALGMTLDEVVACATSAPARFLGMEREIGTLRVGAHADVAVFELVSEPVELYDCDWKPRHADKTLRNRATFVGGRLLPRRPEDEAPRHLLWHRGGRDDLLYQNQAEVARLGHAPRLAPPLAPAREGPRP
jgi:dihydroorotase